MILFPLPVFDYFPLNDATEKKTVGTSLEDNVSAHRNQRHKRMMGWSSKSDSMLSSMVSLMSLPWLWAMGKKHSIQLQFSYVSCRPSQLVQPAWLR